MESRVIDLEIRFAHLEELVQQLSDVVRDQADQIEALHREVERLKEGNAQEVDPDQRPPHY